MIPHDVGGSSLFALSLASPAGTAPTPAIATASAVAPGQGIAPAPLTVRQREILSMAASGLTNAQIARRLHVAISTVERHCTMAYRAMGVRNRAEALVAFYNPAAA
ncbi:MAG: helix-turn-helix transcriptional regulator [Kineosporiaceae bacterium]